VCSAVTAADVVQLVEQQALMALMALLDDAAVACTSLASVSPDHMNVDL